MDKKYSGTDVVEVTAGEQTGIDADWDKTGTQYKVNKDAGRTMIVDLTRNIWLAIPSEDVGTSDSFDGAVDEEAMAGGQKGL